MLSAVEFPATDGPHLLRRGVELATELKQHLFDTFYHAVAPATPDTTLISADERYLRAAREKGRIVHLMECP
jgi:predicted nucleic acid-binding protein